MALTAVAPSRNTINSAGFASASLQVPRVVSTVAIDTADTKGFAVTQAESQSPACVCSLAGDVDWYWADTDSLAVTAMRFVLAGQVVPFQCTPGKTQNFYMKTAVAANISLVIEG